MVPAFVRRVLLGVSTLSLGVSARADDLGEHLVLRGNGRGSVPCVACHGLEGEGNALSGFPVLAGLDEGYLVRQLRSFREGVRSSPTMAPTVSSLSDDEIAVVASWYASKPLPDPSSPPPGAGSAARAEALVRIGDWRVRDLPSCVACHGPGLVGVGDAFPRLVGQHASYVKAQLVAFRDGTRTSDPGDLMGTVARKLTDGEIEALADWIAARPVGGAR